MNGDDAETFKVILRGIGELYGKDISSALLDLYWRALERHDIDDIRRAANNHVRDPDQGQFFPKPADIERHIAGNTATRAMTAWSKVIGAVKRVGPWQSVVFDDSVIHAVLADMGGWIALGEITDDETPFKAREFEQRYRGYLLTGCRDYPRHLIGLAEHRNAEANQRIAPPVLVGNPRDAQAVLAGGSRRARLQTTTAAEIGQQAVRAIGRAS
ncbi:MAG TPA: DUF6475 domain-containing protein [Gammaproteobacteria bacterium]|nr:DUF6475 domain-containing protein [Gammaproteobacteria bacterium]